MKFKQSCEHQVYKNYLLGYKHALQLRALAALAEDQGLLPSTHMAARRHL